MGTFTQTRAGRSLYQDMLVDAPREAVIRTAVEDFAVPQQEADMIFDAFLQWLSALPLRGDDHQYVMLKSDVDRVFHAFILNTREYRHFCDKHLGRYVDHHPITGDGARVDVEHTVSVLRKTFADDLSPYLALWERDLDSEAWVVSCVQ